MVKRDLWMNVILFLCLVLGIIGLRVWFFEPVTIQKEMANDYIKTNDLVIALKGSRLTYGDFALYEVDGKEYIGRVIAVSGDKVTYMDDVLYRNDKIVEETYLKREKPMEYYTEDLTIATITGNQTDTVSKDSYLILNDIRTNHKDSRSFGLISSNQIIGRLTFRLSPLKDFGFIDDGLAND